MFNIFAVMMNLRTKALFCRYSALLLIKKTKTRKMLNSTSCEFCLYPVVGDASLFFRFYFLNGWSFWLLLGEEFRKIKTCHVEEFVERRNGFHQT